MSVVKSFSVGAGDTFYIQHNSSNFTIIDCCLSDDNKEDIVKKIKHAHLNKRVTRFISTHPDQDHIQGLKYLDDILDILNFYCVKNKVTKEDETEDFKHYCELRDSKKAFYIFQGCSRKWMNQKDEEIGSAGIDILWPIVEDENYQTALKVAENDGSPNNISAIIKYSVKDSVTALWMGDLEADFMNDIADKIKWPKVNILFAPHHGRRSGKIPEKILKEMNPDVIVIGEAPSEDLNYYSNYNVITQNSAGDITFDCDGKIINIFSSNRDYSVDFLDSEIVLSPDGDYYIGTLNID